MRQIITADLGDQERVETGALRVNDDWTGLFIRGDDCITLTSILERYLNQTSPVYHGHLASVLIEAIKNDVNHSGVLKEENEPSYKDAEGVIPWKEGDELPEDAIRRIRGHKE